MKIRGGGKDYSTGCRMVVLLKKNRMMMMMGEVGEEVMEDEVMVVN